MRACSVRRSADVSRRWARAARRQDAHPALRSICERAERGHRPARRELRLPRLHAHRRARPAGLVSASAPDETIASRVEAARAPRGARASATRERRDHACLVVVGARRPLPVLRRAVEHAGARALPLPPSVRLVRAARSAQPTCTKDGRGHQALREAVSSSEFEDPSSLARATFRFAADLRWEPGAEIRTPGSVRGAP